MHKPLLLILALAVIASGCAMFGETKQPEPAPVAVQPAPPPPPAPPAPLTHTVKKGDTVASIAKKYGVPAKELLSANQMRNSKAIKTGMVLTIPGKTVLDAPPPPPVKEKLPKGKAGKDPYGIDVATALEKGKRKYTMPKYDDAAYERIKEEFKDYARKWLEKSQALSQTHKGRKDVTQEGDHYVASYSEILLDTMETEVKRVDYSDTPFVGHITYRARIHRTVGPTPQAAQASQDEKVSEEFMREIFSYNGLKRVWR